MKPKISTMLPLVLAILMLSSCAMSRKCSNPPVSYKIKMNQFVFPVDYNQKHYCYDIYITDSFCSIYQINKVYKKPSQLIYDTLHVESFRLSEDDIEEIDSIFDNLWKKRDTMYSSNTIDGNLTNLYLMKNNNQKKIVIFNRKVDVVDRLIDIVNVYCNKTTIPLLQRTFSYHDSSRSSGKHDRGN